MIPDNSKYLLFIIFWICLDVFFKDLFVSLWFLLLLLYFVSYLCIMFWNFLDLLGTFDLFATFWAFFWTCWNFWIVLFEQFGHVWNGIFLLFFICHLEIIQDYELLKPNWDKQDDSVASHGQGSNRRAPIQTQLLPWPVICPFARQCNESSRPIARKHESLGTSRAQRRTTWDSNGSGHKKSWQ